MVTTATIEKHCVQVWIPIQRIRITSLHLFYSFLILYLMIFLGFLSEPGLSYLFFQLLRLGCWSSAPEWGFEYSTVEFLLQYPVIRIKSWASSSNNVESFLPPKISQDYVCIYGNFAITSNPSHKNETVSCVGWLRGTAALDTWTQLRQRGIWWANNSKFYFYHMFGCYTQS